MNIFHHKLLTRVGRFLANIRKIFKILSKYITFVAYEFMRKPVQRAYTHMFFTFQMGVNPGVAGCQDANLKLTVVWEDNRHKKNKLFCLFMDFKGAFTSMSFEVIIKIIHIMHVCPKLPYVIGQFDNN